MPVIYAVSGEIKRGYILVQGEVLGAPAQDLMVDERAMFDPEKSQVLYAANTRASAHDWLVAGIIKSIIQKTENAANLFVVCSANLWRFLSEEGE